MIVEKTPFASTPEGRCVGKPILRKEDLDLLTGNARFLDDVRLPGMLYMQILRSPLAHARIKSIDVSRAIAMPGVHAVLTGNDLVGRVKPWGDLMQDLLVGDHFPLAVDKVMYVGHEVAAVVADTKYQALDATEAIVVNYEELPVVIDAERALEPDAPLIQENIVYEFGEGNAFDTYRVRVGDIDKAQAEAAVIVRQRFSTNRPVAAALEPHGCIASYDTSSGQLTIYSSTQSVFFVRDGIADALQMPKNAVRVIAPEVGGGFGSKAQFFPWEVIASIMTMQLGRPVHYILSRKEVFQAGTARNGQVRYAELYVRRDGTIVGYKDRVIQDSGAMSMWGNQVIHIGTNVGMLPYAIPNIHVDGKVVHTNTAPGGPLRGFGIPQMLWAKEQLVDMAAEQLGMDPLEIRLKNIIDPETFPFTTPMGQIIDNTSIAECVRKAADVIGWAEHRRSRRSAEGIGMAVSMKYTSCRHPSLDTDLSAVRLRLEPDGTVTINSSDVPHGQGHATMLAQIVSDVLGIGIDRIKLARADTETSPFGLGTFASRAAAVLGTATREAALRLRSKLSQIASHILEVDAADLEFSGDRVYVRGVPNSGIWIETLAGIAAFRTHQLPPDFEPTMEVSVTYDTPTERERPDGTGNLSVTYSGCAHAARVAVDRETGRVRVLDYVMVHDTGVVINPLIVEGQHQGGFLMGYAMTFGEGLVYDDKGRLLNGSFKDYLALQASDVPDLTKIYEIPAPSVRIPGGHKGAGESATGPVPACIANAVADAIGIRFASLPITPDRVLLALKEKERRKLKAMVYPDDIAGFDGSTTWGRESTWDRDGEVRL